MEGLFMAFLTTPLHWRWSAGLCSLLFVIAQLGIGSGTALAAGPTPQQIPQRPDQPAAINAVAQIDSNSKPMTLPALKAVVTVGNIDGPNGPETLSAIATMKPAVDELIARGVSVTTFYPPNDDWNTIKAAANGAHFFFYGGHGIGDSNTPTHYGGMWFTPNFYVSPAEIKANLKLAPNAIVMLFACFTAGSGTEVNITGAEALRRVSQYSEAFFAIGAAGYYANSTTYGFQAFTRNLFNGLSLGDAFKNYPDYSAATTEIYTHPAFSNISLWLDKDYYAGGNKYNNAFGGFPNLTLQDLFSVPAQMVARPSPIVALTSASSPPQVTHVTVSSTNQV
ncbi:MAG: hypothetical protein Q7U74_10885, partial [Saprospiraceae bacterium]|nr:hypothetical protein [Saprospiraceae bacterium]